MGREQGSTRTVLRLEPGFYSLRGQYHRSEDEFLGRCLQGSPAEKIFLVMGFTDIPIYILSTSDKGVVKRMVGFTTPLSWVLKHF